MSYAIETKGPKTPGGPLGPGTYGRMQIPPSPSSGEITPSNDVSAVNAETVANALGTIGDILTALDLPNHGVADIYPVLTEMVKVLEKYGYPIGENKKTAEALLELGLSDEHMDHLRHLSVYGTDAEKNKLGNEGRISKGALVFWREIGKKAKEDRAKYILDVLHGRDVDHTLDEYQGYIRAFDFHSFTKGTSKDNDSSGPPRLKRFFYDFDPKRSMYPLVREYFRRRDGDDDGPVDHMEQ